MTRPTDPSERIGLCGTLGEKERLSCLMGTSTDFRPLNFYNDIAFKLIEEFFRLIVVVVLSGIGAAHDHDDVICAFGIEILVANRWLEQVSVIFYPLLEVKWFVHCRWDRAQFTNWPYTRANRPRSLGKDLSDHAPNTAAAQVLYCWYGRIDDAAKAFQSPNDLRVDLFAAPAAHDDDRFA